MNIFKTIMTAILWVAVVIPVATLFVWCFFVAPMMVFFI